MTSSARSESPRAVLFSGDLETGECSMDVFEGADFPDPHQAAEAVRDSCVSDFPTRVWTIHLNDAAREIMASRRVKDWLG